MNFFRRQLQYVSNSFFLDLGFQVRGWSIRKKKPNRHPYSINKLSTKKNTKKKKKSLFLNTLRCNHLPKMTPKKKYCFFRAFASNNAK